MIDMLGEDARAAVGKVKSLQSKGATPDQIDAQMMEAARNGLLPISVAFAAQRALKRQNPPAPPPQGTVVGDMMQQLQPRQQGIAGLSAPTMDTAQYAGGGIVAFAEAGAVKKKAPRPLTPEEEKELARLSSLFDEGPRVSTGYGFAAPPAYTGPGKDLVRKRFEPRYNELLDIARTWREGEGERKAATEAEKLSQQYMGAPLPAAPEAPAAAAKTEEQPAGLATLTSEDMKKYFKAGETAPERSAFAGIRTPRISSRGYDQAVEQAVAQFAPTDEDKKTRDQLLDEELARYERLGIGEGREKRRAKLGEKRTELEADRKRSKLEEIGMGFLTEGVAAASRGESTLGALATGFGAGLKGAKLSKEKLDAAEDKLDEQEAALDAQKEALMMQGDAAALQQFQLRENRVQQGKQAIANLRVQQASTRLNIDQFNIGNEFKLQLAEAGAAAQRSKVEKIADPYLKAAGKAFEAGDEKKGRQFLAIAAEITAAASGGVQTERVRQAGRAAENAALYTNPAGAQAGSTGQWGKSTIVDQ